MKLTGNKKAQNFGRSGLIDVITKEVNNMSSLALSFNDVNFSPVEQSGQIWLTATELAKALGYAKSDAVTQVYDRNQDEFNSSMTTTLNLSVVDSVETLNLSVSKKSKNLTKTIRIFSLRGCHLIAMFSKTTIAKQFRKWVLDVLDREVLSQNIESRQTITSEQAGVLYNIVHTRAKGNGGIIASMWSRLKNHFKYSASYRELKAYHFEDAKFYLENIEIKEKAAPKAQNATELNDILKTNLQGLAIHMVWLNDWWKEFGGAIAKFNPNIAASVNHHFKDGACFAYHFIDKGTRLQIEEQLQYHSWNLSLQERYALDFKCK